MRGLKAGGESVWAGNDEAIAFYGAKDAREKE